MEAFIIILLIVGMSIGGYCIISIVRGEFRIRNVSSVDTIGIVRINSSLYKDILALNRLQYKGEKTYGIETNVLNVNIRARKVIYEYTIYDEKENIVAKKIKTDYIVDYNNDTISNITLMK